MAAAPRRRPAAVGGRGAGLGHGDRHRQDRDADREPHGRAVARRRRTCRARWPRSCSPTTPTWPPAPAIRSNSACCATRRATASTIATMRGDHPVDRRAAVRQRLEVLARHGARARRPGRELPQGRARGGVRPLRAGRRPTASRGARKADAYAQRGLPRAGHRLGGRPDRRRTCRCSVWRCSGIRRAPRCPPPWARRCRPASAW